MSMRCVRASSLARCEWLQGSIRRPIRRRCIRILGSSDLPLHTSDANLFANLLVVVEPFVFAKIDASELGAGLSSCREELALELCQFLCTPTYGVVCTNLSLELCELEPSAIE
jgi:hypothetical protein